MESELKKTTTTTEVVKKPKSSRNTEKRRERSKVAARCRRGKEGEIFTELSQSLPVSESSRSSLDKASVMRLTLCDLKLKEMLGNIDGMNKPQPTLASDNEEEASFDALINGAVSGVVLVCSCDGDIIFVSEGIATCLGLSQYEVMGQSLFEVSHPCDQADVKEMLTSSNKTSEAESKSALFRMKSTNSTRGRNNVHHRTTNYKVVSCVGRIFTGDGNHGSDISKKWFVGICEPLLHPSDVDIPLNKQTFLSKHSPDMKFEYVDESISEFLGYKVEDMVGKSLFDFYHACDGNGIARSFKSLYTKGQTVTERSRFLSKKGGWIWVITQATSINNNAGKPTSVVCIHFVTSGVECPDAILSDVQLSGAHEPIMPIGKPTSVIVQPIKKPLQEATNLQKSVTPAPCLSPLPVSEIPAEPIIVNPFTGPIFSKPTANTSKIFAQRTKDMDTGFLMPVNDTLIVTKDEPIDLTHLAPMAGDECVPLSNVPLLDDLLQWLDAADMEYAVLEGYEDPLPLPLIASVTDTSIPMTMTMCHEEMVVKNDVVLERMPSPHCDSPLLLPSTDANLLSSSGDPLLLSPFKTSSPEPSSSCLDIMNPDLFTNLYEQRHTHSDGGGGCTMSSSDKCKDGGYDDPFTGFPIVSDFQEHLFSPARMEDIGPPVSPALSLMADRNDSRGGAGTKLGGEGPTYSGQPYKTMTKEVEAKVWKLKYMSCGRSSSNPPCNESCGPPPVEVQRPLPCKVAKPSYNDSINKAWLHPATVTPPQPPWKIMSIQQHSPPVAGCAGTLKQQQITLERTTSTSTGTQTMINLNPHSDQIRQLKFQRLLRNPLVLQALINGRLAAAAGHNAGGNVGRKRNFLGKLLGNCSNTSGFAVSSLEMAALVELTDQDCEVNAPLNSKPLLDGPELLTALDTAGNAADLV